MKIMHNSFLGFQPRVILLTIVLIIAVIAAACSFPFSQAAEDGPAEQQAFSDPDARMYQMYFDSSADPEQNELQVRRFMGHLHLAEIEDIFGDIQSLPLDANCNYYGGPVVDEGLIWYVTVTSDLYGANLVSVAPDGAMSSAFDLDGDRVADIVDIRLADNRRISFVTEHLGLEVFASWLRDLDILCSTDQARQSGLRLFGCDETGDGSSGSGAGSGWSGIVNPIDLMCSQYDTGPGANLKARAPIRSDSPDFDRGEPWTISYMIGDIQRVVTTMSVRDPETDTEWTERYIIDTDTGVSPPQVVQFIKEKVDADDHGTRTTHRPDDESWIDGEEETFDANSGGATDYPVEGTDPPPRDPPTASGGTEGNPGPEGDDTAVAEFCRNGASHQSGVEQAANTNPSSMSVSCDDLVGAPDSGTCVIVAYAGPGDFQDALASSPNDGCDPFQQPDGTGFCEPASVAERLRGHAAEFRSLDLEDFDFCPQIVCDPEMRVENTVFLSGEIEVSCPVITEPVLEPSEENCPPGTYYAPVTDRCIEIQLPDSGGGSDGGGGCNLSSSACSAQGYSFDENKCECVPIQ